MMKAWNCHDGLMMNDALGRLSCMDFGPSMAGLVEAWLDGVLGKRQVIDGVWTTSQTRGGMNGA